MSDDTIVLLDGSKVLEVEEDYLIIETANGDEMYVSPRNGQTLVEFDDLDLDYEWRAWHRLMWQEQAAHGHDFSEWIRTRITEPYRAEDIIMCPECAQPGLDTDAWHSTKNDGTVCDECITDFYYCTVCDEYDKDTTTVSNEEVCESCLENLSYCDECETHYFDGDSDNHLHGGCNCEPPTLTVRVRNGEEFIGADERVQVTLPGGVISDEGMNEICYTITRHADATYPWSYPDAPEREARGKWYDLAQQVRLMDARWQTKDGNFTKRLGKIAHKQFALKVPPALVSQIGNVASAHSQPVDFGIEFTRNLNLSAEDFGNEESCWWQSYAASRCILKTQGGMGMRTFEGRWDETAGRAWVMPMRYDDNEHVAFHSRLKPTFDAVNADAFMVFNGYGNLRGYSAARIMAQISGMTYRKVSFSAGDMYVNSESGYLVAAEEIATHYTDGHVSIGVDEHSNLHYTERTLTHV